MLSLNNPKAYEQNGVPEKPQALYTQITGLESSRNPFVSNINYQYSQHIAHTQKPLDTATKTLGTLAHQKQNELIIGRFRQKLIKRGPKGLIGLRRQFKIMDSDGSGQLDFSEFRKALDDYRVGCTGPEADQIFSIFDHNRNGSVDFEEFMNIILGEFSSYR
jgi:hypothetical protein